MALTKLFFIAFLLLEHEERSVPRLSIRPRSPNCSYGRRKVVESITTYATQHKLGVEVRLRLLLTVCSAVDYAHRNFIVHRDLEPGNSLVDPAGVPKLLDFGICKLLVEAVTGADLCGAAAQAGAAARRPGERAVLAEQSGRRVARGSVRWRPRVARPARDAPGRGSAARAGQTEPGPARGLEAGPGCHSRCHARGCCYRGMIESAVILRPCWMKGGIGS